MATIKFRRGSGQPTGLTAYEPAWDTTNNRLFVNNGSTAMWVGAQIVQDTALSGNCAWTVPTQNSVKTYVDNQVTIGLCGGSVASINGITGAANILGGTGISITASTATRGITVAVNSDVAIRNGTNIFTGVQVFTTGLSGNTDSSLFNLAIKNGLTVGGPARFESASVFTSGVSFINGPLSINGTIRNDSGSGITFNSAIKVLSDSTFNKNLDILGALNVNGGGTFGSLYVVGPAAIDGSVSLLGGFDAKGASFGNLVRFGAGICASGGMTLSGSLQASNATFGGLVTANSGLIVNGGATFNGNIYASNLVTSVDGVTGAVDLLAGSGISITNPTGAAKGITLTNTGVLSIAGTSNQITASGSTGSVTLSLPSAITTPGSLSTTTSLLVGTDATISGNLTVNGTTTTVNSTTVTVQDPIIAIGGLTGNIPPVAGDVKDRGVVFQWNDGGTGKTGFFGHDTSTGFFTYISNITSLNSEVVSGTPGTINVNGVRNSAGTNSVLTLTGVSASNATITLRGGNTPAMAATDISLSADTTTFSTASGIPALVLRTDPIDPSLTSTITSTAVTAARTFTLPDISGSVVVANTMGATSGWLLRGTGSSTAPTWINPNASGFTAFTTTNVNLVGVKDSGSYGLIFALGTAGNQILYGDSTTGIAWQPSTNTLTVGSGTGKLEGVVDGGAF